MACCAEARFGQRGRTETAILCANGRLARAPANAFLSEDARLITSVQLDELHKVARQERLEASPSKGAE